MSTRLRAVTTNAINTTSTTTKTAIGRPAESTQNVEDVENLQRAHGDVPISILRAHVDCEKQDDRRLDAHTHTHNLHKSTIESRT